MGRSEKKVRQRLADRFYVDFCGFSFKKESTVSVSPNIGLEIVGQTWRIGVCQYLGPSVYSLSIEVTMVARAMANRFGHAAPHGYLE